jgi:hypothetical protein
MGDADVCGDWRAAGGAGAGGHLAGDAQRIEAGTIPKTIEGSSEALGDCAKW